MDHPVFGREPFTRAMAWCWLIEHAAWRDTIQSVGRHNVRVQRGQIAVAVRYLAEAWQWSKSSVDRFLTRLETGTMIGTHAGTQYSIITICNYDKYQADCDLGGTRVGTGSGTRAGHERDKEEEGKKGRNLGDRNLFGEEQAKPETNDGFERWWALVPRKVGKGAARLAFKGALKKAGSIEVLIDGIRRYAVSVRDMEARYIAHPGRWLRDERWLDETSTDASSQTATAFDREWAAAQADGPEAIEAFLNKHRRT